MFDTRPERAEIAYTVDVSAAAGLRLVADTLEILTSDGSPVLRVPPPYAVDATGTRRRVDSRLEGCSFDASPVHAERSPPRFSALVLSSVSS